MHAACGPLQAVVIGQGDERERQQEPGRFVPHSACSLICLDVIVKSRSRSVRVDREDYRPPSNTDAELTDGCAQKGQRPLLDDTGSSQRKTTMRDEGPEIVRPEATTPVSIRLRISQPQKLRVNGWTANGKLYRTDATSSPSKKKRRWGFRQWLRTPGQQDSAVPASRGRKAEHGGRQDERQRHQRIHCPAAAPVRESEPARQRQFPRRAESSWVGCRQTKAEPLYSRPNPRAVIVRRRTPTSGAAERSADRVRW